MDKLAARATEFYNIFPSNPDDQASVDETKAFLETFASEEILENRNSDGLVSWRVSLKTDVSIEDLNNYGGIKLVEKERSPLGQRSSKEPTWKREEDEDLPEIWRAFVTNLDDREETSRTGEWLKTKVKNKDRMRALRAPRSKQGPDGLENPKIMAYGPLVLDQADIEEVKQYPGIRKLEKSGYARHSRILPSRRAADPDIAQRSLKQRADGGQIWTKQENAPDDLVMDSTYDGASQQLQDFVYEERGGRGTLIYILDRGINIHVKDENGVEIFRSYEEDAILTLDGQFQAIDPINDENNHGTKVASKALGTWHGTAKDATLVNAKLADRSEEEIFQLFEQVLINIKRRKERNPGTRLNAVVVFPWLMGESLTHESYTEGHEFLEDIKDEIQEIMDEGVPVVVCSGNDAKTRSDQIDTAPSVFESPSYPLIVVGSIDLDGKRSDFSQGGPHLTVHAPAGEGTKVHGREDGPETEDFGTSFAAPQVAGIIAVRMNYDPWGQTTDSNRVQKIKEYIMSEMSSREVIKDSGVKTIWNGAGKDEHNGAGANRKRDGTICEPKDLVQRDGTQENPLTCNGIDKIYISSDTIARIIDEEFCPLAAEQGRHDISEPDKIRRVYLKGSSEEVNIAIEWPKDSDWKPNVDECRKYMHELHTTCDKDSSMNWKAGGNIHVGEVVYRWNLRNERPKPALNEPKAGCEKSWKLFFEDYTVWGAGWASSDFGHEFHDRMNKKNLAVSKWKFEYGMGDDGREWTATFRTVIGADGRIQDAAKDTADFQDLAINC